VADVTVPTDIELAFATATARLGTPDLVVACAGTV
jgi:NAD(P)-dependent dehydrogenase (short-subunit alcohol dehydrogenase family)